MGGDASRLGKKAAAGNEAAKGSDGGPGRQKAEGRSGGGGGGEGGSAAVKRVGDAGTAVTHGDEHKSDLDRYIGGGGGGGGGGAAGGTRSFEANVAESPGLATFTVDQVSHGSTEGGTTDEDRSPHLIIPHYTSIILSLHNRFCNLRMNPSVQNSTWSSLDGSAEDLGADVGGSGAAGARRAGVGDPLARWFEAHYMQLHAGGEGGLKGEGDQESE